jgi:hypothetical protein
LPALSCSHQNTSEIKSGKGLKISNVVAHANASVEVNVKILNSSLQEAWQWFSATANATMRGCADLIMVWAVIPSINPGPTRKKLLIDFLLNSE